MVWIWLAPRPVSGSRFRHCRGSGSVSVVRGCMSPVASAPTDSTAPVAGVLRRRGKSKAPNFSYSGPVSVIRLELDASDDRLRRRLDHQWAAVFRLRRALQRDAVSRCRAYWASRGRRHGPPRIGSWWDFTRIPGRARSHTKTRPVCETWRLTGTLDGHLAAYRHPRLPQTVSTARAAAAQPAGTSILAQLARLPAPDKPASGSWWDHDGALAVVLTGLPGGDVVLPVRLPQGAGQWEHLCHFLADPTVWHKIDLVRVRDRHAAGGWRYYAHLLTHQRGYGSASTKVRRSAVPDGRSAGVDANVSNLSVASFRTQHTDDPTQHTDDLVVEQITLINEQQQAAEQAARRARVRQRALDRSRRNTNPDQYGPPAPQSGQVCPGPTDRGGDRRRSQQYNHRRGLRHLHLGQAVGQTNSAVQLRHARRRAGRRMRRDRWAAAAGRHPHHRAQPALPMRTAGAQGAGAARPSLPRLRAARQP